MANALACSCNNQNADRLYIPFTDYQQIYNKLKRPLPSRKDELSEYLDELDKEFKK